MSNTLKEIVLALSLANLMFIGTWRSLFFPKADYFVKHGPSPTDFVGGILSVLLTAGLLYLGVQIWRRIYDGKVRVVSWLFLIATLLTVNVVRHQLPSYVPDTVTKLAVFGVSAVVLILAFTKLRDHVFKTAVGLVMIVSPFVLITFFQASLGIITARNSENETPLASQIEAKRANLKETGELKRVIWIVFDEFDYRTSFESGGVSLPEFNRLRSESLSATQAVSPAYWTMESIPSLLTGRIVEKAVPLNTSDATVKFSDGSEEKLSETRNVFRDVATLGGKSAVVGNYHPYCRTFRKELAACSWEEGELRRSGSLSSIIIGNIASAFGKLTLLSRFFPARHPDDEDFAENASSTRILSDSHSKSRSEVNSIIVERGIQLAFVHWRIPHPPSQYDPDQDRFVPEKQDYRSNLILADRDFGSFRKALEEKRLWKDTAVIVSSDHHWRISNWKKVRSTHKFALTENDAKLAGSVESKRIPFIVKLPGSHEGTTYDQPFNTVITRKLISDILRGEISTLDALEDWLDDNAQDIPQSVADQ